MTPYYEREGITVYVGDNRDVIPELTQESIDAVVTDPPYGLSFMGRDWDQQVPGMHFWEIIRDAMKPGAHLLSFGGSRTFHRMAVAIEDAGLEIRDTLMYLYGSGFPKSLNVSKAIDKAAGAERDVIGIGPSGRSSRPADPTQSGDVAYRFKDDAPITAPTTDEAKAWNGWGTALKPSVEPIILARKPISERNIAQNVLAHGTGALNIDACRIQSEGGKPREGEGSQDRRYTDRGSTNFAPLPGPRGGDPSGRWPANVLLDENAAAILNAQSGERKSNSGKPFHRNVGGFARELEGRSDAPDVVPESGGYYGDTGGASRFFPVLPVDDLDTLRLLYCPKASRAERNAGLDDMPEKPLNWSAGTQNPGSFQSGGTHKAAQNHHPTVKPLALMRWLITLITPPGGVVLDPFAGSGSTLVAAAQLGVSAIGIELSEEYAEIAARRIDHALSTGRQGELSLEVS